MGLLELRKSFANGPYSGGFWSFVLLATPPFKNDNKIVAHVIVLLTFFLIIMLIKPLLGAMNNGNQMAMIRVA